MTSLSGESYKVLKDFSVESYNPPLLSTPILTEGTICVKTGKDGSGKTDVYKCTFANKEYNNIELTTEDIRNGYIEEITAGGRRRRRTNKKRTKKYKKKRSKKTKRRFRINKK